MLVIFDLRQVGWIQVILQVHKVLLDAPRRHEAVEDRHASGLVVRSARTGTTKRLLTDDSTSALLIVVHIARSVTELVRSEQKGFAVL